MVSLKQFKNTIPIIITVSLFCLFFSPYHALTKHKLFADDASYLAHGFTLGLDGDLQYKDSVADWKTPNQKAAAHPIGPGVMASPFIAAFSTIDKLTHHPVITEHTQYQYSWSFFGFVFSSIFFFIAGVCCYAKAADLLAFKLSRLHLLFISSSFGILYYVLFRPVMGHSFEFFTMALCFWASCKIYFDITRHKINYLVTLLCALSLILTLQIRPSDINVLLLPLIVVGFLWVQREKGMDSKTAKYSLSIMGLGLLCLLLCFIPFLLINQYLYGMFYPSANAMYGPTPVPAIANVSDFIGTLIVLISRLPHILTICFSSEFGLAFSSAILLLGTGFLTIILFNRICQKNLLALVILGVVGLYIALPVTITLFWQSLGDAYGYRFFFCLFPIAFLGYGAWHQQLIAKYDAFKNFPLSAKLCQGITLLLCCYSLVGNVLFGLNSDLLYKPGITNSFGREGGSAVGYNFEVLRAIPKGATWVSLAATRTPGFLAVGLLDMLDVDIQQLNLPETIVQKYEKLADYEHPPWHTYCQALLLGLLFVGGYSLLLKRDFTNKAS
ncbi:MAG: hypothetical protein AB7I18_06910 [Candidatus Berkiella sp.]